MQKPDISFSMHVEKKKEVTPFPIAVSPARQRKVKTDINFGQL